ncbi:MAG: tetratricopeptide repeat protein [Betaproteobacteria bacterium]|nr:tetratricopeptide repeat protein [Betaproteobacteria bacterium]
MSEFFKDVTTAEFDAEVLETSGTVPVVVDFWAPWCAPCKVLKPILEKLAAEYGGRFVLAKVNTDENPEIAAKFGVRGIPSVKGFRSGEVVAEFTGALPESAVRAFLDELIPSAGEKLRLEAKSATGSGDFETAESKLQEALKVEPGSRAARFDLAELLVARQAYAEAELVLQPVPEIDYDERARQCAIRIKRWKSAAELPAIGNLKAAMEKNPADLDLRIKLSERHVAEGDMEAGLEQLMAVVRADRGPWREKARKAMVEIFSIAAEQTELVSRYRRMLASELH